MAKYDFRMDGELEAQFLDLMKTTRFRYKSSLIRELVKRGMVDLVTDGALEKLRYDQTHGWEITRYAKKQVSGMYQDLSGNYHIPFEIFQESAIVKDTIDLRDGKKCRKCGKNNKIFYHYIDGNTNNNNLENIVTLCEKCKIQVEKFMPKKYASRLFAIWFYMTNPQPRIFKRT